MSLATLTPLPVDRSQPWSPALPLALSLATFNALVGRSQSTMEFCPSACFVFSHIQRPSRSTAVNQGVLPFRSRLALSLATLTPLPVDRSQPGGPALPFEARFVFSHIQRACLSTAVNQGVLPFRSRLALSLTTFNPLSVDRSQSGSPSVRILLGFSNVRSLYPWTAVPQRARSFRSNLAPKSLSSDRSHPESRSSWKGTGSAVP